MERLELVSKVASETNGHGKIMKTRTTTAFASLALLCGLCFFPPACAQSLDARCSDGACDQRDAATADSGDSGPPIDPCLANPTTAECLDESKALFVSNPKGNGQDATGTRAKPFKTINAALAKIDVAKRRIYICAGTYPEDIALNATHSGVSLFGGVDCEWAAAPGVKPVIGATANPFKIDRTNGLTVANVAVEAKDATSGSSVAALVSSGAVTFKGVRLLAGAGARGGGGTTVPFTFPDAATTLKGKETSDNTGAGENSFKCPGGVTTVGGRGGNLGFQGDSGSPGAANRGLIAACGLMGSGGDGAGGAAGTAATGGASLGVLTATGWVPANGKSGDNGGSGQGGGGGYGSGGGGGGGGGGGAGGCGGAGGAGGLGGGGSVGLAIVSAAVTISESVIETKAGGDGGGGVAGQGGQPNGGGKGNGLGCPGGVGAAGGSGGGGAGGAGGISIAVLYAGVKPPATDGMTEAALRVGTGGKAGPGSTDNDGAVGTAAKVLEAK